MVIQFQFSQINIIDYIKTYLKILRNRFVRHYLNEYYRSIRENSLTHYIGSRRAHGRNAIAAVATAMISAALSFT